MCLSNPRFVLALLAVSSFGNFLSVDGKCKIKPVDGHVDWPSKKKNIKRNAFKNCKELRTISIPPEVESIHNTAFYKSGLDLTELQNYDADSSPLFNFKGPLQIEKSVEGEPFAVLTNPPIDYILSFTLEPKGIIYGSSSGARIIQVIGNDSGSNTGCLNPGVFFSYETTKLTIVTAHDASSCDYHYIWDSPLDIDSEYDVAVGVLGMTSTVSVNGVVKSTKSIGTRQKFDEASIFIGANKLKNTANAIISNIRFDKQVSSVFNSSSTSPSTSPSISPSSSLSAKPSVSSSSVPSSKPSVASSSVLFNLKGPLQIEKSVRGDPAAVLAAPPTDYTLQFTIELKGLYDAWSSIISLTAGGYAYPDYLYGTLVPGVYIEPGTTQIYTYYQDDENGSRQRSIVSRPLELNKKSTVIIKVYGATVTISVNGVIENTEKILSRSQLNDVELYIGDPWTTPANAILSDISFG